MMWRYTLGLIALLAILVALALLPVFIHSDAYDDAFINSVQYMR